MFFGTLKCGEPVFAGFRRLEVIYNGAKSAGTVPRVFSAFQNSISGARSVLAVPKLNFAAERLLERSKVFWACRKCAGTVL
jgi:hypothetical protein